MAGFTYKPQTRKGPVFLAPTDQGPPVITLADGRKITGVRGDQRGGTFFGHEGYQYVFDNDVLGQEGATLTYGGQTQSLGNTNMSYRGDSVGNLQESSKGAVGDYSSMGMGGEGAYGMTPNPFMMMFNPINYDPIKYKNIKPAPYNFVDPIEAAGRYNTFNRAQEEQAYQTGKARGTELTDLDTRATMDFARQMSGLQQDLVQSENTFNQAQRLQAVDFAMPDLRSTLDAKRKRGETYASGRLLSSAEDRAYEVAARSSSADGSFTRGFGDDSVFGRRTSDVLSAQQRLGISQMGEGLLNDWISQGSSLLIDTPLKSSISQRLPSVPGILPSQQAAQQQSNLTNMTTVPLQFGISSEVNQEQYKTNLIQGTRTFNAGNRLQTSMFNASNELAKDQFNSSGQFQASQAQFQGLQSNYQLATQASNRAEDIARQDAANEAASVAADRNIKAQQGAGDAGAIGGIVGTAVGIGAGILSGGFSLLSSPVTPTGAQSLQAVAGSAPQIAEAVSSAPVSQISGAISAAAPSVVSDQGGAPQVTSSGAPTSYQGAAIPVASSETDGQASALDIASGYKAIGKTVGDIGQSGPSTPQMASFGQALANGGTAAQAVTTDFPTASTQEAKMQLTDQLHGAALNNAPTPESRESVDQIFSQVKEHLDTGVGVGGQAAGIAGFVQHYNDYSGPEKARAITNISFAGQNLEENYGVKDLTSDTIGKVSIPGTGGALTMRDALSLANSGYNVPSLVDNWDDIKEVHSTLNESGNVLSVATTARNLGMLSSDTPETIRNKQSVLKQAGAQPAGAWGAGAVAFPSGNRKQIESTGMTVIGETNDGQSVAVPIESIASTGMTNGILGSGLEAANLKDMAPRTLSIGQRTANVYNNWPKNYIAKQQPAMGGSPAVANGMYKTGAKDPSLLGNIVLRGIQGYAVGRGIGALMGPGLTETVVAGSAEAVGAGTAATAVGGGAVASSTSVMAAAAPALGIAAGVVGAYVAGKFLADKFGGGKSKDQGARDSLRSTAQELGLVDEDFNVTLASGQKFDIGVDGHGGKKEWHNKDLRRPDQTDVDDLHAWDVDYTKDLDAVANLSGTALSMLMYGTGDDHQVRQMGNYFTNAAVSDAGSADITRASFGTSQANMKGFFQKAGIETKGEAYALSNQMFQEGRVTQFQYTQIQQGINLTFDSNGFQAANQLLEGVKLGRKGDDIKKPTPAKPAKETPKPVAPTPSNSVQLPSRREPAKIDPIKAAAQPLIARIEAPELTNPMEIQSG